MLMAGDIGATQTRLGLFSRAPSRPDRIFSRTYGTAAFVDLEAMLARFLADAGVEVSAIEAVCFGAAGPIVSQTVSLTNASWHVDARSLAARLGVSRVRLLNDLEAMAYGVTLLRPDELVTLQPGVPTPDGNAAVIAPGTGLGEALLHRVGDAYVAIATEAGHADLAARTDREVELLRAVIAWFGRADNERVLSGQGLLNLHRFTHERARYVAADRIAASAVTPADVTAAALDGTCLCCAEALELFVGLLGAEAGNLALRSMATAGVYLGGGIPPKILTALQSPSFLDGFRAKQPLQELMETIPVHVVLNQDAALIGAAVVAGRS
jgi:glucokinase